MSLTRAQPVVFAIIFWSLPLLPTAQRGRPAPDPTVEKRLVESGFGVETIDRTLI
jgi:hypothetical protein